jgi:hypothetical protein
MYNLNEDAITKIPTFFDRGSKPLVTLTIAKEQTIEYFNICYDFDTKLKTYIQNVENCKTVLELQQYIYNAAIKGFTIKSKVNMAKAYKENLK